MSLRKALGIRPIIAVLAATMVMVALACAGEAATPTSAPTATTAIIATIAPTSTPVPVAKPDSNWMEKYVSSPGYDPAWGEPVYGGTFRFGANTDRTYFPTRGRIEHGCYQSGCYGQSMNVLFRVDPWIGGTAGIEGDLVESWAWSDDGLTLTMKLREGIFFSDLDAASVHEQVPDEYNGGKIRGDEWVCEDAKYNAETTLNPKEFQTRITNPKQVLGHTESVTCPDGPRGHTLVWTFSLPLAKTMAGFAVRGTMTQFDKQLIEWLENEHPNGLIDEPPDNFVWLHGTGPFVAHRFDPGISKVWLPNPTYWRAGLPLFDRFEDIIIKDATTRFAALASGTIHFYGEGSYGFTAAQAEQAMRDFKHTIVVGNIQHNWGESIDFGHLMPPFNDVRVRKAINLAVDREAWRQFREVNVGDTVLQGTQLAWWMAPGLNWAIPDEELKTWPGLNQQTKDEDIAEANRILDEIYGVGERPDVKCASTPDRPAFRDSCLFLMDQAQKHLGWNMEGDFTDGAVYRDITNRQAFKIKTGSAISTQILDPDDWYLGQFLPEYAGVSTKLRIEALEAELPEEMAQIQSMIREQSIELDPIKREGLVHDIERFGYENIMSPAVLGWENVFPSWSVHLKGYAARDLYIAYKWALFERLWLAP